ncbi:hypothetical protein QAD02_012581 [Eretmocerus hayati]|uniref:Uncharacterized protein n=1 Tax=Eretmocerus hayati TaxID=131215 RepID=A0ACC2NZV1_9HYME|nr:hypothetical protein QAD02_012581 [Eretmocerus hayati]
MSRISSPANESVTKGGLAEEVDEKIPDAAFIPFGEIVAVQIPLHYEPEKHRGFAFIEFGMAEDAAAAIDNMVSFGTVEREVKVNIAKLQNIEEGPSKLVWTDDIWLQEDAGERLDPDNGEYMQDSTDATSKKGKQNPSVFETGVGKQELSVACAHMMKALATKESHFMGLTHNLYPLKKSS